MICLSMQNVEFAWLQSLLCFYILYLKIEYLEYLQLFQQHLLHSVCVFVVDGDNFQHH